MHLTLHLTDACNMRCHYCYAPPKEHGRVMSRETGRQALDFGARITEGSCGIIFFGGEPLLHRDLIQALVADGREREQAKPAQFHFKLTTNGLLLDEAFLDFTLKHDVLVAMSFDGVQAAHDRHRLTQGEQPTYDRLLGKLKLLLAARPYSSVLMVVNPDTAPYLAESVAFLLDLGARYLIVSLNYAAPWTERDFRVLTKQYQRLGKKYIEWTRAGRKFYLSPFEVKLSSHINRHCYHRERCELARRQISVDPDGWLFPCVQFVKAGHDSDWCIGHLTTGIDEAARQRLHDASEADKASCRECAVRARCNNTCGCLNWQATGSINTVSPVLCRHERLLMPIADHVGEVLYGERNALFLQKHYNVAYPVLSLLEDTLGDQK